MSESSDGERWQGEWQQIMRIAEPVEIRDALRAVFERTARRTCREH